MKSNHTFMQINPAHQKMRANQAWLIDFMVLDFTDRPFVMLVVDVGTRRPLSATVGLVVVEDIIAMLERLVRRSGRPEQVWLDHSLAYNSALGDFHPALQAWAKHHRTLLTQVPMLRTKFVAERLLRDLSAFLRGKSYPTLMELGHDLERWRQQRAADTPSLSNADQ